MNYHNLVDHLWEHTAASTLSASVASPRQRFLKWPAARSLAFSGRHLEIFSAEWPRRGDPPPRIGCGRTAVGGCKDYFQRTSLARGLLEVSVHVIEGCGASLRAATPRHRPSGRLNAPYCSASCRVETRSRLERRAVASARAPPAISLCCLNRLVGSTVAPMRPNWTGRLDPYASIVAQPS